MRANKEIEILFSIFYYRKMTSEMTECDNVKIELFITEVSTHMDLYGDRDYWERFADGFCNITTFNSDEYNAITDWITTSEGFRGNNKLAGVVIDIISKIVKKYTEEKVLDMYVDLLWKESKIQLVSKDNIKTPLVIVSVFISKTWSIECHSDACKSKSEVDSALGEIHAYLRKPCAYFDTNNEDTDARILKYMREWGVTCDVAQIFQFLKNHPSRNTTPPYMYIMLYPHFDKTPNAKLIVLRIIYVEEPLSCVWLKTTRKLFNLYLNQFSELDRKSVDISDDEIKCVMEQTNCSRPDAVNVLKKYDNIVEAILNV